VLFDKRDPKSALAETREQKQIPRAKFGQETINGEFRRPKWLHIIVRRQT
jgi:hypothetical protein